MCIKVTFAVAGGESVTEQFETSKKLMTQLNLTWDEKISQTQTMRVCFESIAYLSYVQ